MAWRGPCGPGLQKPVAGRTPHGPTLDNDRSAIEIFFGCGKLGRLARAQELRVGGDSLSFRAHFGFQDEPFFPHFCEKGAVIPNHDTR